MQWYLITFRSVTFAQRGERVLAAAGIPCTIRRTPKWMEARGCGYSLRLRWEDISQVAQRLEQAGVTFGKIYRQTGDEIREVTL